MSANSLWHVLFYFLSRHYLNFRIQHYRKNSIFQLSDYWNRKKPMIFFWSFMLSCRNVSPTIFLDDFTFGSIQQLHRQIFGLLSNSHPPLVDKLLLSKRGYLPSRHRHLADQSLLTLYVVFEYPIFRLSLFKRAW